MHRATVAKNKQLRRDWAIGVDLHRPASRSASAIPHPHSPHSRDLLGMEVDG